MEKLESSGGEGHEVGHRIHECDRCKSKNYEDSRVGDLGVVEVQGLWVSS
jgi:hypothetical protein